MIRWHETRVDWKISFTMDQKILNTKKVVNNRAIQNITFFLRGELGLINRGGSGKEPPTDKRSN